MNLQEIQLHKKQIDVLLPGKRVFEALAVLKRLVDASLVYEFNNELANIRTSYQYMLQFFASGAADPEQEKMLTSIITQIYTLRDKCIIHLSQTDSFDFFFARYQSLKQVNLSQLLEQYNNITNKYNLLVSADVDQQNQPAINDLLQQREKAVVAIFNKIWCTFPLSSSEANALRGVFDDNEVESDVKSVLVSALFLGICKFFDEQKLALLLHAYCNCSTHDVQIRAIVAFVLVMYIYQNRTHFSSQIQVLLDNASQQPCFQSDLKSVFNRLIRSRNTENITKLMREDLMPNLLKIRSDIFDKIKDKNTTADLLNLEANPEWQEWLDKSGISKKMEELNELQFEGGDVFISAFSHLKSFPFFNTIANWFLPYNSNHSSIKNSFSDDKAALLSTLIKSAPVLCDSDKYSLCFSLSAMPDNQLQMMMNQFHAQQEQLKEMADESKANDHINRDRLINQYVQDLYRFFKLYSRRRDFPAIFDSDLNLINIPLLAPYMHNKESISIAAEFYFKNGFYNDAISYYKYLLDNWNDNDMIIYQKIGFAYQLQGDFEHAVDYYLKYDIINDSDLWNLQHIAACYKALKNNDKSFEYYLKAYDLKPESITTCLSLGHHCLEKSQLEEALKYYYKVDYLDTKKHRSWRPIAWCSFLKGDFEQSRNYYEKIINNLTPTAHDYLNYGHLVLCSQGISGAIDFYVKALNKFENKHDVFAKAFNADAQVLTEKGIDVATLPLICDTVFLNNEQNPQ